MSAPRQQVSKHFTTRERLIVLSCVLEFRRQQRLGRITMLLSNGRRPRIVGDVVADAARQSRVSRRSVWRWLGLYDRGTFESLAHRPRRDSFFARRPDAAELLAGYVLRDKLSARAAHDALCRSIKAPPCYMTVSKYARRLRAQARAARRRRREKPA